MDTILEDRQMLLKVYELNINRIMKEGDWYWLRFSLFLSLNLGGLAALGFLMKEYLNSFPNVSTGLFAIIEMFLVAAIGLALMWEAMVVEGGKWQAFFVKQLAAVESELNFKERGIDTFTLIHNLDTHKKKEADSIVATSVLVARCFRLLYAGVAVLAGFLYILYK
ncbi:MAG: hypothetical protein HY255_01740 [Betaproteobacteria bacterium]|nr:hypothetical protein [Betaproteobacteria bacterium]